MTKLADVLEQVNQRTGRTTGNLQTNSERALFQDAVRKDVAAIAGQLNNVYSVLVDSLIQVPGLDVLDYGITGNAIYTDSTATVSSATAFWDTGNARQRSVKETVDVILSEISRLENAIAAGTGATAYDDTVLSAAIAAVQLNLTQLRKDTMGGDYTFDGDGVADLTYPLAEILDAIGSLFTGYTPTGIVHGGGYPALTFTMNLSDVVLDTTIPEATITDLEDHLDFIRSFVGKALPGAETPTYSDHGAILHVSDGQSLEEAIQALDAALLTGVSPDQTFVYVPGGTQTGNRYTSWNDLVAAVTAAAAVGHVKLVFDQTITSPIVIPAGTFDATNISFHGTLYNNNQTILETSTGTVINNLEYAEHITFNVPLGVTGPPLVFDGGASQVLTLRHCTLTAEGDEVIQLDNATTLILRMEDCVTVSSSTEIFEMVGADIMYLQLWDTQIRDTAFTGGATADIASISVWGTSFIEANQPSYTGTVAGTSFDVWAKNSYNLTVDDASLPFSATSVQDALEAGMNLVSAEITDWSVPVQFINGIADNGTWQVQAGGIGDLYLGRTPAASTDGWWCIIPLPDRAHTDAGFGIKSIEAAYSIETAALNDIRFELWIATLGTEGVASTGAVWFGDLDAHYDAGHNTAVERAGWTAGVEYHRLTVTNPDYPGIQYDDLAADQYLMLRIYVDGTATGVFFLDGVMIKFYERNYEW